MLAKFKLSGCRAHTVMVMVMVMELSNRKILFSKEYVQFLQVYIMNDIAGKIKVSTSYVCGVITVKYSILIMSIS